MESFSCRIENVKSISDIISCLFVDAHKEQNCNIEVNKEGITFVVSATSKSTQARIGLQSELFEEFECDCDQIKFILSSQTLIDCLNMFGTSSDTTTATMSFTNDDAIFKLSLEDAGVITVCEINTLFSDDYDEAQQGLFTAFRNNPEECQIIIKSDSLKESIQELTESLWAEAIHFEVNNNPSYMKLSTGGTIGMSEMHYPRSSDAFVSFKCMNPLVSRYSLKSWLLGMKALSVAKETYIRVNTEGIMCIQHQIASAVGQNIFLDFLMVAEEEFEN